MERKPKLLDAGKLMNYAVRVLGGRAYSLGELREKLRRKAERVADIDPIIARLKELGYLDDRAYAEHFAATQLENAGVGKMRVLRELRQRRVAPKVADQVVEKTYLGSDEAALIEAYLERKYRAKPLPQFFADEKNVAAAYRRLRYAGFSSGASIRVLKRYSERAEELADLDEEPPAQD